MASRIKPVLVVPGHTTPFQSLVFPIALQSKVLFLSLLTNARRAQVIDKVTTHPKTDLPLMYYYGMFLQALRQRLDNCKGWVGDDAFIAMFALLLLEQAFGKQEELKLHETAIFRLNRQRRALGRDSHVDRFIDAMSYLLPGLGESAGTTDQEVRTELDARSRLEHPGHPFPPALCAELSSLPINIVELALASQLSFAIIDFVQRLQEVLISSHGRDFSKEEHDSLGKLHYHIIRHLATAPKLNAIERSLAHGMTDVILQLGGGSSLITNHNLLLDLLQVNPKDSQVPANLLPLHRDCRLWTAMAFAAASPQYKELEAQAARSLDEELLARPDVESWIDLEAILKKFFWSRKLGDQWKCEWILAQKRAVTSRPLRQ